MTLETFLKEIQDAISVGTTMTQQDAPEECKAMWGKFTTLKERALVHEHAARTILKDMKSKFGDRI